MLGASNAGTHNQETLPSDATSAPVWQSDRNAYSAIGGTGDGAAALCGSPAGRGAPLVFSDVVRPALALVTLMMRATVRASGPPRPAARRPRAGPTTPSHTAGREVAR